MSNTTTENAPGGAADTVISNVPPQSDGLVMQNGVPTIVSSGVSGAGVNVMSGNETLHTISVLVENQPGVLARVSHVFARRGFNIESLAVSRTEDPTVSRMTIVVAGSDELFDQMGKQMLKLIDVIKVIDHTRDNLVQRELALIKVRSDSSTRGEIMQIADVFRANLVDISDDTVMIEVTGKESKVDAIQRMLEKFEILELVRTGRIVLVRGPKQT
jgi:acetolactate synthase-1/3 small subunit